MLSIFLKFEKKFCKGGCPVGRGQVRLLLPILFWGRCNACVGMPVPLTFKNPYQYEESEAYDYLILKGALPCHMENFVSTYYYRGNAFQERQIPFCKKYGEWLSNTDRLYTMQSKIMDVELVDRCFSHCPEHEFCDWEKRFIREYAESHKDEPTLDILLIVPSVDDMIKFLRNEMYLHRRLRPIHNAKDIFDMAVSFISYMTRNVVTFGNGILTINSSATTLEHYKNLSENSRTAVRSRLIH